MVKKANLLMSDDLFFLSSKVEEKTQKYQDQFFLDSLAIFKTKFGKNLNLGGDQSKI